MSETKLVRAVVTLLVEQYGAEQIVAIISSYIKENSPSRIPPDDCPIDRLELSVRSHNLLDRAGLKTVGDIRATSDERLLKIPHMGKKSFREIKDAIDPPLIREFP